MTAQRLTFSAWRRLSESAAPPIGAFGFGAASSADPLLPACIDAELLAPVDPVVDAWCSSAPLREHGRCGNVRWRHDGHWLIGALELDEALEGMALESLVRRAYRDVFETLERSGCRHLLRVWNYLPRINADSAGMERYRRFNAARQQAFLDASYAAFEGSPAACAIGVRHGPFRLRFLAGRARPLAIENPRQLAAYHYPRQYGPRSPTFSRAALVSSAVDEVALFISGTASIVGHASVHLEDVREQTRETIANLQAVIAAANARGNAQLDLQQAHCTIYVRHTEHAPLVRRAFQDALGAHAPAARNAVLLLGDICRSELLVEIEAHAIAPGRIRE